MDRFKFTEDGRITNENIELTPTFANVFSEPIDCGRIGKVEGGEHRHEIVSASRSYLSGDCL